MNDLISRCNAIDAIDNANDGLVEDDYTYGVQSGMEKAKYVIEQLPSAQPEIIRCRDCKHLMKLLDEKSAEKFGQEYACECGRLNKPEPDDFCSRAEQKENR